MIRKKQVISDGVIFRRLEFKNSPTQCEMINCKFSDLSDITKCKERGYNKICDNCSAVMDKLKIRITSKYIYAPKEINNKI